MDYHQGVCQGSVSHCHGLPLHRWYPDPSIVAILLRMIPEKRRTRKMMRMIQTREKSGRSHVSEDELETTEGEDVDSLV